MTKKRAKRIHKQFPFLSVFVGRSPKWQEKEETAWGSDMIIIKLVTLIQQELCIAIAPFVPSKPHNHCGLRPQIPKMLFLLMMTLTMARQTHLGLNQKKQTGRQPD